MEYKPKKRNIDIKITPIYIDGHFAEYYDLMIDGQGISVKTIKDAVEMIEGILRADLGDKYEN